jgi:hypothetical protein
MTKNCNGVSLIELLAAVILATMVTITLSLALPRSSAHIIQNQISAVATNLAASQIAYMSDQTYASIYTSDVDPQFSNNARTSFSSSGCDCSKPQPGFSWDWSQFPSTSTVLGSTTYSTATCVNYIFRFAGNWQPQCATSGDTGYKEILVHVTWTNGAQTYSTTQATTMTRY